MDPETDTLLRDLQQIINLSRRVRGAEGGKDEYALTLISSTAQACLRRICALSDTSLFVVEEFKKGLKDRDK
jgi:hypothetical protein